MSIDSGMTVDGANWLTTALDPFHDTTVKLAGLPDQVTDGTVVQTITQSVILSQPGNRFTQTKGATWRFCVFNTPDIGIGAYHQAEMVRGRYPFFVDNVSGVIPPGTTTWNGHERPLACIESVADNDSYAVNIGAMTVFAFNDDTRDYFPDGNLLPTTFTTSNYITPDYSAAFSPAIDVASGGTTIASSQMRIISAGFEVINTTAPLYQSGTCTVSRTPSSRTRADCASIYHDDTGRLAGNNVAYIIGGIPRCSHDVLSGIPPNEQHAMAYEGSKQWEAARGAYCVCRFNHNENNLVTLVERQQYMGGSEWTEALTTYPEVVNTTVRGYSTAISEAPLHPHALANQSSALYPAIGCLSGDSPAEISCAMFSGLSPQSTFRIVFKWTIELSPRIDDKRFGQLAYSATPSAAFDPAALQRYHDVASLLPAGVPQDKNPSGEFWNFVRGIASAVGVPDVVLDVGGRVIDGVASIFSAPSPAGPPPAAATMKAASANVRAPRRVRRAASASSRASRPSSRASVRSSGSTTAKRKRSRQTPAERRRAKVTVKG